MTDEKQTLSPAEWKSVTDYLIELSQKVQQATGPGTRISEPCRDSAGQFDPAKD